MTSRVFRKNAAQGMGTLCSLRDGPRLYNGRKSDSGQVCEQAPVDSLPLSQFSTTFSFWLSGVAKCISAVRN